ncbi:MAG: calcium-binding protein [Alphaproteobacteria bacterium]|nr:calcium-binding protein [Alphaproteobacteria bacterium]
MAVFDASASDDTFEMYDLTLVEVGSYQTQTATVLEYMATDGLTVITLTGSFTYAGGVPTSGTVSRIDFDSRNDGGTDITISFDPSEYPDVMDLVASGDSFWRATLAGADTITPAETGAPGFVPRYYYGDFLNISSGETLIAQNDTLDYAGGGGSFFYYADAGTNSGNLTGGDDSVMFTATQPTGGIYLDVNINSTTGVLVGGDDIIDMTAPSAISTSSSILIFGDANSNFGTLTGGNDTINVRFSANATIYGDANLLTTGTLVGGDDTIYGSIAGTDLLYGDVKTISAGTTFTGGDDTIDGSAGNDTIYGDYETNSGGTIVSGGNDVLNGGSGDDFIYGNEGDDLIDGGQDDDTLDGGAGTDTVSYDASFFGVTVSLALQGSQQDTIGAGLDTLSNFINLTGSNLDDILTGDANDNTIDGGGETGAGPGDDIMGGGAGVDTVSYASSSSGVKVSLATQGVLQDTLGGGFDTLSDFENLTGSGYDDLLFGDSGNNVIDGGLGSDIVSYAFAASGVQVYLTWGNVKGGDGNDTLISIETVTGSSYDDRLIGSSGVNILAGGSGNDIIKSKGGGDQMDGDGGDDSISGGAGVDTINGGTGADVATGSAGNDIISGDAGNDFLYGNGDDDTLNGGADDDKLTGGKGNDTLNGDAGIDRLFGGKGDDTVNGGDGDDYLYGENGLDTLNGGAGNDSLTGGSSADTFVFELAGGYDKIKDWEDGTDQIDLTSFGLTGIADVLAIAFDYSAGVRLEFADGSMLLIENETKSILDAGDFIF